MRTAALLSVLFLASPALADEGPRRLEADWLVDGAVTGGALLGFGAMFVTTNDAYEPPATQGEPPSGLDALGVLELRQTPAHVSDALLYGSIGLGLAVVSIDGANDSELAPRLLIYAEALALNGLATEGVKRLVSRPRPYTYDERTGKRDDDLSFWSGHSSWTACSTLGAARVIDLTSELTTAERVGLYGGAGALTLTVMGLRVAAGKHFPTDVLTGGAVGALLGLGIPSLHAAGAAPTASAGGGGLQLGWSGSF